MTERAILGIMAAVLYKPGATESHHDQAIKRAVATAGEILDEVRRVQTATPPPEMPASPERPTPIRTRLPGPGQRYK